MRPSATPVDAAMARCDCSVSEHALAAIIARWPLDKCRLSMFTDSADTLQMENECQDLTGGERVIPPGLDRARFAAVLALVCYALYFRRSQRNWVLSSLAPRSLRTPTIAAAL